MSSFLLAATESLTLAEIVKCPTSWGLFLGCIGLWMMMGIRSLTAFATMLGSSAPPVEAPKSRFGKTLGGLLLIIALGLLGADLPWLSNPAAQGVFWLMAAITLISAIGCITAQSPVYSALWFAMSLLGTSGLFFQQGAQFLAVATIVVYAGAIVVTFLFVLMLAQPEGHAAYDRISWGWFPRTMSVLTAAAIVAMLTMLLGGLKQQAVAAGRDINAREALAAAALKKSDQAEAPPALPKETNDVLNSQHMARLGGYLFSRHLISIEVAGTLLLAALVGAVAIAIQGKQRDRVEEALSSGNTAQGANP
ncbi:NADH-quinone oxidoreductase subunit J family protein [Anatilimnocola floriformis]|uniref:NADH-quinone oxidoreductase subunit J family protein n=1 Tax=Anatilimnocola floriformis TaxID=2948575 RepID=UPI0020C21D12|nr:NADH-quinone oxidoreductase subunit J [Anatilimnocola floriformis]